MSHYTSTSRDYFSRSSGQSTKLPVVGSLTPSKNLRAGSLALGTSRLSYGVVMPPTSVGQVTADLKDLKIHSSNVTAGSTYTSTYSSSYSSSTPSLAPTDITLYRKPSSSQQLGAPLRVNSNEDDTQQIQSSKTGKRYNSAGFCGLRNLGNTCFMNSVLQCLSNTKLLLEYILNGDYRRDLNTTTSTCKGALISAFADLLTNMWDGISTSVSPSAFKSAVQQFAPRFSGYNQQDSQEFLRYLLQGLQEDVNHVRQRVKVKPLDYKAIDQLPVNERADIYWQHYHKFEDSKIVDIFVGQLKSTLKCQVCGYESIAFDPFWDLSLPIPKGFNTKVDLNQCITNFMKEEILDGQERARCDSCQKLQSCTKRFSIYRFPSILVIHLKRFSQGSYGTKLTTLVEFPINALNLSKFCDSNQGSRAPLYDLYAISNHSGSMYSGHYTAYARHPYDLRWYEYNDSRVSSISSRSLVTQEAYVLFYEQSSAQYQY